MIFLAALCMIAAALPLDDDSSCPNVRLETAHAVTAGATSRGHESEHMHSTGHALLQIESTRFVAVAQQNEKQQHKHRQLLNSHHFAEEMRLSSPGSLFVEVNTVWKVIDVLGIVFALCLSVAALKFGMDYYEDQLWMQGQVGRSWYTSDNMQLKFGVFTLGVWIAVGIFVFTQMVHFNTGTGETDRMLSFIEAAYLCMQVLTTVGYGDYTPSRGEGQVFMACFILIGVVVVAVVVTELLKTAVRRGERAVALAIGFKEVELLDEGGSSSSVDDISAASVETWGGYLKNRHRNLVNFLFSVGPCLLSVLVGTMFFSFYQGEQKSTWEAFYMSCITVTTVGFGVFTPATKAGKLFASVWMLVGVGATANMIVSFGDWFFYSRRSQQAYHVGNALLAEMDADQDGTIDQCEYLYFQLIRSGMCHREDVDRILHCFSTLEFDGKGVRVEDLRDLHEEPAQTQSSLRQSSTLARARSSLRSSANRFPPAPSTRMFWERIRGSQETHAAEAT